MRRLLTLVLLAVLKTAAAVSAGSPMKSAVDVNPRHISTDPSIRYDYDIVYVRAPRLGDDKAINWNDVTNTLRSEAGSDLMLLHPNGREEVLVAAGQDAITDPFVSFDGEWVYYARVHNVITPNGPRPEPRSSDIFKMHVKTRKVVRLTWQEFTPNTGVALAKQSVTGVYNLGPCPLPGRKVMFTSNRNGFQPTKGYTATTLQLFVMDDNGDNVEEIGFLNINSALHPTILKDGRVMFSSYESQGLRDLRLWAVWAIRPDGTNWEPLVSNLGIDASAFHFMSQLSDEQIVVEEYYNLNNQGFGTYYRLAPRAPKGQPFFGPASRSDPRNIAYLGSTEFRFPFSPLGMEWMTPFVTGQDSPAPLSNPKDPASTRVGKLTHPSGAPDNHLLTVWSPGPVNSNSGMKKPAIDGGLYLIKSGSVVAEPAQMRLIKNDPNYNEQWPRALVPYKRIYGVDEPAHLPRLSNDGKSSRHLPEGTPFGLVGTSSLYKRESYPDGVIPAGTVTAAYKGGGDPYQGMGSLVGGIYGNWWTQGGDTCRYENSEIHAIRILAMEPTTNPLYTGKWTLLWWNGANERLRILGEFPVRKFRGDKQPTDPDGNPDTSFLVKIPADFAWTFQTLDKNGMVLNMAQTWHQLRPGEIRTNCGGCHAHSQQPTLFEKTAAAREDYVPFDLTRRTPLLTTKEYDQSGKKWDKDDTTGLRFAKGIKNVEFFRDIKPIFERSCVACHTKKWAKPAGELVLDDEALMQGQGLAGFLNGPPAKVPGTFFRLADDQNCKFGYKSPVRQWILPQVSRYVRLFSARRSLLAWKIFGERLDGWKNEDFATESVLGDPKSLYYKGSPFPVNSNNWAISLAYTGSAMPPPEAVAGTYEGPDGKKIKVPPLSDEDRRTLVRWIDLGCAIDLDYNPARPKAQGHGWMADDDRPTLTLTYPAAGANEELTRILIGMHDYYSGLDENSMRVLADFHVDGVPAGRNLARKFKAKGDGVWELKLANPIAKLPRNRGNLTVSVRDQQGNETRIQRTFWITPHRK